jgi:hypothetical protein
MVMNEESLLCPACGKNMEEIRKIDLPLTIIKACLPPNTDISKLIFIRCPSGHGYKILIPLMSDIERSEAVREHESNRD